MSKAICNDRQAAKYLLMFCCLFFIFIKGVNKLTTDFDKNEVQNALKELKSIITSINQFEEKYQTLLNSIDENEEGRVLTKEEHDEKVLSLLDKYSKL